MFEFLYIWFLVIFIAMTAMIIWCIPNLRIEYKEEGFSDFTIAWFKWYFVIFVVMLFSYFYGTYSDAQDFYQKEQQTSIIADCTVVQIDKRNNNLVLMKNGDVREFRVSYIGEFAGLNTAPDKLGKVAKNDIVTVKFFERKEDNYVLDFIDIVHKSKDDSFTKEKF